MFNGYIFTSIFFSHRKQPYRWICNNILQLCGKSFCYKYAMKSDFSRKTCCKFERKVSHTFVGRESGLQKFMKIVFLVIQSCGGQSFMFKIIHSLEYVFINVWFKMATPFSNLFMSFFADRTCFYEIVCFSDKPYASQIPVEEVCNGKQYCGLLLYLKQLESHALRLYRQLEMVHILLLWKHNTLYKQNKHFLVFPI